MVEGLAPRELITALVELQQTGRKLLLYPPTHALIPAALEAAVSRFSDLWAGRPDIAVSVSSTALHFSGEALEPHNPVLVELARRFADAHIARLTFRRELDGPSLSRLFAWLQHRFADAETQRASLIEFHQATPAITISLMSFEQAETEGEVATTRGGSWDQLIDALINAGLSRKRTEGGLEGKDWEQPEQVAELINRAAEGDSARYERLILEHLQHLARPLRNPGTGELRVPTLQESDRQRLSHLIEGLEPPVRDRLFRLAFNHDGQGPGALGSMLDLFSEPVLLEVLCQIQSHDGSISVPTLELLRKFVGVTRDRPAVAPSIMEHLDGLDLADRHALYAELFQKKTDKNFYPDPYAKTIRGLSGNAPNDVHVPHEPVDDLVSPLNNAEIDRHTITVLLELTSHQTAAAHRAELIEHLGTLLPTLQGDSATDTMFQVFETLKNHTHESLSSSDAYRTAMSKTLTPVIRAIPKLDKSQVATLTDHLVALGEPIVPTLVEILNSAPDLVLRKRLMEVLVRIGHSIGPSVMPWLSDERWYILRNMIALLGDVVYMDALPRLLPLVTHSNEQVRIETLRALARLASAERMIELFSNAVYDSDDRVASCAINLLCHRPTPKIVERLRSMFESEDRILSDMRKLQIIDAIARGKDPSCLVLLSRLARQQGFLFFSLPKHAVIRKAARDALRKRRIKASEEHGRAV